MQLEGEEAKKQEERARERVENKCSQDEKNEEPGRAREAREITKEAESGGVDVQGAARLWRVSIPIRSPPRESNSHARGTKRGEKRPKAEWGGEGERENRSYVGPRGL